jgi:TPR repeat protein
MKRALVAAVSVLLCVGATQSISASSKPDLAKTYFERRNCHLAYDVLVEDNSAGRPIASADIEWARGYESAGSAGEACPEPPEALLARSSNRTVASQEVLAVINRYRERDPQAKFELAYSVLTGKFTAVGPEVAWGMLREAADAGEPSSLFLLGSAHVGGLFNNNQADYASGAPLVERAAQGGHIDALFMAGNMYKDGIGVRRDSRRAFEYYRQAAERGHAYATIMAFDMINSGEGTRKDFDLAYRLGRNMAEQGEVYGAVMAASALLQSRDVLDHKDEVLYWMDLAIRDGDADLRAQITPLRAQAIEIYNRPPPPPRDYSPRPFKACPMKTVCLVNSSGVRWQCTTNKDYWNDCDG